MSLFKLFFALIICSICLLSWGSDPALLERLKKEQKDIIGLELVVAGEGQAMMSNWGHVMFRLVQNQMNPEQDLVISFSANTKGEDVSYLKGVFGGYELTLDLQTLGTFRDTYVLNEDRHLIRLILPSTVEARNELISEIIKLGDDNKLLGNYSFLGNNCAVALLRLLGSTSDFSRYEKNNLSVGRRPRYNDIKKVKSIIPTNLPNLFKNYGLTPYPELIFENNRPLYKKLADVLAINTEQIKNHKNWPANSATLIEEQLTESEIKRILLDLAYSVPIDTRRELAKKYNFRDGRHSSHEVLKYRQIPAAFYDLCQEELCIQKIKNEGKRIWGIEPWESMSRYWKNSVSNMQTYVDYLRARAEEVKQSDLKAHFAQQKFYKLLLK